MEPFHFGSSGRRLFGVYHPPLPDADRGVGVVLCYPTGQEYIRSHRAFLQLAIRLSAAGFPTLRFDYSGCGDSEHGFGQGGLSQWAEDSATALRELREGSGVAQLCLIGLRIGGSIAAITAANHGDVEALVLWDPIAEGGKYLMEIRAQHQEWLRGSFARPRRSMWKSPPPPPILEEVLGFPLSAALVSSLHELDLLCLDALPAKRVLVVDTQREDASIPLLERLRALGSDAEHQHVSAPPVWVKQGDELGNVAVPAAVLDALVGWMKENF